MPSTFSLGTYTAMFSSILMSLSLPLHLASDPPPYNHTQSSHHNCSRKNGRSQDLLIPVTPSCLIHIPNSTTSHNPRSAHRRKRKESIPMVEIARHKAVRQSTQSTACSTERLALFLRQECPQSMQRC
ncbi:hypothetical protein BDR07DRAFT_241659 [Suillus spraguei]|nr:hypothetical protein BDR07DRAFT_241659 [Suillus spraguei]